MLRKNRVSCCLVGIIVLVSSLILGGCAKEEDEAHRMLIDIEGYGITGRGPTYEASYAGIYGLMKKYPNVDIGAKSHLKLEAHYDSGRLMSIAGRTAPDVFYIWFHEVLTYAKEGFLYPLDEYVGADENRNGKLDDDEIKWPEWKKIHPNATLPCIYDGHVWAMPQATGFLSIIYRRDLFAKAGLDPNRPPKDWDELFEYAQKLTFPRMKVKGAKYQRGQQGLYLSTYAHEWLPYFWSAGGDLVLQGKKNPRTGHITWFKKEERIFKDEQTSEDLSREPSIWKATFASEEGVRALELYKKLRWQRWTRCPDTNEPFNLPQDVKAGDIVTSPFTKKQYAIPEEDIYVGVIRVASLAEALEPYEVFNKGEVAMQISYMWPFIAANIELSPEQYSCAPIPAGPGAVSITNQQPTFRAIAAHVKDKRKRDICWELITLAYDPEVRNKSTRIMADAGLYQFLDPRDLLDAGLKNYYDELQPFWREQYPKIIENSRPEGFNEGWTKVQGQVLTNYIFKDIFQKEDFDPRKALVAAQNEANDRIFGGVNVKPYRPVALGIAAVICAILIYFFIQVFLSARESVRASSAPGVLIHRRPFRIVPWLIMAPALLSLFIWAYYPLAKGLVMAFQDYHISKESPFAGLDNFISIFMLKGFYRYLLNTVYYIGLTMILGFIAPIILGILLSELLVGKYFYRIIYYLPQVTSAPVIALLWKLMYEPTENGFFNQVLIKLHLVDSSNPLQWLNDSRLAMLCIVISAVWASVGAASIIYLAALKSVPDDLYEAADVDGAGTWSKIWRITLPQLKPLIVINFVGAFVGAFQATQNILLMTGGGPGDATTTLSIAIWLEAFVYLKFGSATAMAWVLGTLLIGFTVFQLRYLKKVEFRRATEM